MLRALSRRVLGRMPLLVFLLGALALFASPVRAAGDHVVVLPTTGVVDQVMANYIRDGIVKAQRDGAAAVVIRLDTPGGALDATNEIVKTLLDAPLPVIVWVAPAGSRAASAGTFITLAANLAFMAPSTRIGAASPVGGQGEDIGGTLGQKVLNDAIAGITGIAQQRGRNVEWAVSTVRDARSSTAQEAADLHAVDGIADSLDSLLAAADGRSVTVRGQSVVLSLSGLRAEEVGMNPLQGFLHLLTDPNIAFVLFTLGFYGLLFELQNPNFATGILGAIALILAFVGFGSLPLNVAGLLLLALSIILFVLELTVTSHGLLTVAGVVCFALGAGALYTEPGTPTAPNVTVALPLIAVMTAATAAFMGLVLITAVRTRRMSPLAVGLGGGAATVPVGLMAEVRRPLQPVGSVYASGEEWSARTEDERPLERGTPVHVVRQEGLTLIVERADVTRAV